MTISRPVLLMTRPQKASEQFVADLDPDLVEQADVIISPLLSIAFRETVVDLSGVTGVIFTSSNGVQAAATMTDARDCPAYCVGEATTRTAKDAGWNASCMGQDAESLIAALTRLQPDAPLLHLRGAHARGDVANTLTQHGLTCDEAVLYDQVAQTLSPNALNALESPQIVIAPLFSPRTAQLFRAEAPRRAIHVPALSTAVASALGEAEDWETEIASSPDAQAMRLLVEKLLQSALLG